MEAYAIYPSLIETDRNLSYEQVDNYVKHLKTDPGMSEQQTALVEQLEDVSFLTLQLAKESERDGGERTTSHRIIEELMIKANQVGAQELQDTGSGLYRVHPGPNQCAGYALESSGHYGLSLEDYAHFTSPIRRYNDFVNWQILSGKDYDADELKEIAAHVNQREIELEDKSRHKYHNSIPVATADI